LIFSLSHQLPEFVEFAQRSLNRRQFDQLLRQVRQAQIEPDELDDTSPADNCLFGFI
jgi:hypothetical protein